MPAAFSSAATAKNSSIVAGGSRLLSSKMALLYHSTLARWMFTGTDQISPS
jgi:hypothetical protein